MVGKAVIKLPNDDPETLDGARYGCLVGLDLGKAKKNLKSLCFLIKGFLISIEKINLIECRSLLRL
jgi:hypothetical protein